MICVFYYHPNVLTLVLIFDLLIVVLRSISFKLPSKGSMAVYTNSIVNFREHHLYNCPAVGNP